VCAQLISGVFIEFAMFYGGLLLTVFTYFAVRVHLRLRERGEEGLPIVGEFIEKFMERYRKRNSKVIVFDDVSDSSDDETVHTSATQNSTKSDTSRLIQLSSMKDSAAMDNAPSGNIGNGAKEKEVNKSSMVTSAIRGN
uniref:Uncharacterized protein n=1 Tax=Parascaris univalens TaxID=6257 RepID=A0A914ZIT7_PARUN